MNQLTPAQMDALLKYAAAKLNMPVEKLAATVSSGGIDALTASLSDSNRKRLNALLSDRSQAKALLESEQFKALLARYT